MKKILFASALSTALLASTALHAQSVGVEAEAETGVGAEIGTGGSEAGVDADVDTGASAGVGTSADDVDAEVQTGATGSVSGSATLTDLGIEAEGFFSDETMTELATEAEIRATFDELSAEQQAMLEAECAELDVQMSQDDELMAQLCAAIEADTL